MIRLCAAVFASSEMAVEKQPKFFRLMANYLKKEPVANFSSGSAPGHKAPIPLMMNEAAEKSLEETLSSEFMHRMPAGKAGQTFVNFLYILGQALVVALMMLDVNVQDEKDPEAKAEKRKAEKRMHEIWGGGDYRMTGASGLFWAYQGKPTAEVVRSLVSKLEESADVIGALTPGKP